jgi:serine-type D-Ala-D-Ala carboxypeptidase/endopeptidase (penicillin-binding protein 4)
MHRLLIRRRGRAGRIFIAGALSLIAGVLAVAASNGKAGEQAIQITRSPHASVSQAAVAAFRARVETVLGKADAARSYWGIVVADRDTGETLYELNPDHYFTPASNAKVFTTALALATLGPNYRFRTTLESKAALGQDGRLSGDLLFIGRGDPDISNRKFPYAARAERDGPVEKVLAEMADEAVAKGLREIDGDVVADDSYFPYDPYPAQWTIGDMFFKFGAPISAIALNDNMVSVGIQPGPREGDPATILTEPRAAMDALDYEITTGPLGSESEFDVVRQPGPNFILLRGMVPLGAATVTLDFAMSAPAETTALALKDLLEARGVRVRGQIRAQHSPPPENTPLGEPILPHANSPSSDANPTILAEHISEPLSEIVRVTNKESQNLHAELLLRAVGRERTGVGSTAAGLQAERTFLKAAGIADGDVVLTDGSGLSAGDLVTPRAMVALLRYAALQPWGQDFIASLPVAGVDGTLQFRMSNAPTSGLVQAKTGEIEHTRALSGYATTLHGEFLAFAIFYNNNPRNGAGTAAPIDAIAKAMVETLGGAARRK